MKPALLWENPNLTSVFLEQEVIIASDDYDILEIFYIYSINNETSRVRTYSERIFKRNAMLGTTLHVITSDPQNRINLFERRINYINNTTFHVQSCAQFVNQTSVERNDACIPYKVFGYKISGK